ncbi:MAG: TRAP transporter large permease subunit, partial [Betaproteobacteria bacterium]|nr:TRAP transporter large permease subunit [Betaproteobacteria bacterium]
MSGMSIGMIMFGALMILLVLRLHIGIAMFVIGAAGFVVMFDFSWLPLLNTLKNLAYARFSNYDLAVIPVFMLMGQFATNGGLSRALFRCVNNFVGHMRGGVAMASIGACASFGAICGSSLATA